VRALTSIRALDRLRTPAIEQSELMRRRRRLLGRFRPPTLGLERKLRAL
jgi:hypothetical protein